MVSYNLRRLKGSRIIIVLLWNLLLFNYRQSALSNLINLVVGSKTDEARDELSGAFVPEPWQLAVVSVALSDFLPKLFYPLAGWLADAKLGRYKVMRYSMWMMWLGSVLQILTSISSYSLLISDIIVPKYVIVTVHVVVYIINALGIAGYHVNVIPFGIDQMEGSSGEQIASFIHWYYWTRNFNFGVIVQFVINYSLVYCADEVDQQHLEMVILIIQMVFLTAALSLDFIFSPKLFKDGKIHNPVKEVTKISAFIIKHKNPVGPRLAHTYSYDAPPARSDLAKKTYGGPFEDDAVEEVVSFWRIVVFLLPARFAVFLIQTGYYSYPSFSRHMAIYSASLSECNNESFFTNAISVATFSLCIPIYEFLIYPFFRNRVPRTTIRIGLGFIVALLGLSALIAVDITGHSHSMSGERICMFYANSGRIEINPFYLVPIIVVMSIGEMLASVSTVEFVMAQSPYGMRGLMLGINFMLFGIYVGFGAVIMAMFAVGLEKVDYTGLPSCGTSFLATVVLIGCVAAPAYVFSVRKYKKRQRGGQDDTNHQTVIESYYESEVYRLKGTNTTRSSYKVKHTTF